MLQVVLGAGEKPIIVEWDIFTFWTMKLKVLKMQLNINGQS